MGNKETKVNRKETNSTWLYSVDPKIYDIFNAYKNLQTINWRQQRKVKVGDIIYFYCINPYKKVMFKAEIIETDIPFSETKDDLEYWDEIAHEKYINHLFSRIKFIKYLDSELLTLNNLRQNDLTTVQWDYAISETLKQYLNNVFGQDKSDFKIMEADSWTISNDDIAVKKTDKSVYKYNSSGIPKKIRFYFNIENIVIGEKREIILIYNDIEYIAYIECTENSDYPNNNEHSRTRILWGKDLKEELLKVLHVFTNDTLKTLNDETDYPQMLFQRKNENKFIITFEFGYINNNPYVINNDLCLVPLKIKTRTKRSSERTNNGTINHLEKAKKDKDIGNIGELSVLKYEKDSLIRNGRKDLAEKIEHIAVTKGDSEGYDILSYEDNGNPRYIEVKTSTSKEQDSFYMSSSEIEFADNHKNCYFIYRVYNIKEKAQLVIWDYETFKTKLKHTPTQYFLTFKSEE